MSDYPVRSCPRCKGVSTAITITKTSMGFMPGGTQLTYQCSACQREFVIEPLSTHLLHAGTALLSLALGALLLVTEEGDRTPALVFVAVGGLTALYLAFRVWQKSRSPILTAEKGSSLSPPAA